MRTLLLASFAALALAGCIAYESPGYPHDAYYYDHDRGIKPWEWIRHPRAREHEPKRRYESETDNSGFRQRAPETER